MFTKLFYEEGDVFLIPLTNGYAVGIAARSARKRLFCYCYPIDKPTVTIDEALSLSPLHPMKIEMIYPHEDTTTKWPYIGRHTHWCREKWPVPPLTCFNALTWYDENTLTISYTYLITGDAIRSFLPWASLINNNLDISNKFVLRDALISLFPIDCLATPGALEYDLQQMIRSSDNNNIRSFIPTFDITRILPPPVEQYWELAKGQQVIVALIRCDKNKNKYNDVYSIGQSIADTMNQVVFFDGVIDHPKYYLLYWRGIELTNAVDHCRQQLASAINTIFGSYLTLYRTPPYIYSERFEIIDNKLRKNKKHVIDSFSLEDAETIAPMKVSVFWRYINGARSGTGGDCELMIEKLVERLGKRPPSEIVAFAKRLQSLFNACARWDIWAAAYIINGGASNDGFQYFCGWLILQGKRIYAQALDNPESLASFDQSEIAECESLYYVAAQAFEMKTGKPFPDIHHDHQEITGDHWSEEELPKRFPRLWKQFSSE